MSKQTISINELENGFTVRTYDNHTCSERAFIATNQAELLSRVEWMLNAADQETADEPADPAPTQTEAPAEAAAKPRAKRKRRSKAQIDADKQAEMEAKKAELDELRKESEEAVAAADADIAGDDEDAEEQAPDEKASQADLDRIRGLAQKLGVAKNLAAAKKILVGSGFATIGDVTAGAVDDLVAKYEAAIEGAK